MSALDGGRSGRRHCRHGHVFVGPEDEDVVEVPRCGGAGAAVADDVSDVGASGAFTREKCGLDLGVLLVHPLANEIREFGEFVLVRVMTTMFEYVQSATFDARMQLLRIFD